MSSISAGPPKGLLMLSRHSAAGFRLVCMCIILHSSRNHPRELIPTSWVWGKVRLTDLVIDREALCTLLRTVVAPTKDAQYKDCLKQEVFYDYSIPFEGTTWICSACVRSDPETAIQDSFITPPLRSTQFASASLQYYTYLPSIQSLVRYIQTTVCGHSRADGPECHTRADALLSADSVDTDYDSVSRALTVSGLWTSPPTGGWTDQFRKPASAADQIEFGLLGADAGLEPEEIKMGGLLAVVGLDEKLSTWPLHFLYCLPSTSNYPEWLD
jgi:hypothetical protein